MRQLEEEASTPDHALEGMDAATAGKLVPRPPPSGDLPQIELETVKRALLMFAPDGDLQLVSIDPRDCPEDRRPPRTFMVRGRWAAAVAWIHVENSEGRNIYWQPNRVRPDLTSKAGKADIVGARFHQIDVDPPKGGGAFDPQAAVEKLNGGPLPPSFIIFSGGGVQAFWRIAEELRA